MHVTPIGERLFALDENDKTYVVRTFPFAVYEVSRPVDAVDIASIADASPPECRALNYKNFYNLELIVTTQCNLACDYCHVREGDGYYGLEPRHMEPNVWKRALDFSFDYIDRNVVESGQPLDLHLYYLGGEPLLNFEAVQQSLLYAEQLADVCSERHGVDVSIQCAMSTNGVLIDESNAAFLAEKDFELGVTIDGLHHDQHRVYQDGSGTLADILGKFEIFRKLNYKKVKLLSVVPPAYASRINEIIDFYRNEGLLSNAYRVSVVPRAITRDDLTRGCSVPKTAFEDGLTCSETSHEQYIQEFSAQVERMFEDDSIDDRNLSVKLRDLVSKGGVAYRCPAALWKFSVAPDGSIWPCHQLVNIDKYNMGSVLELEQGSVAFDRVQREFRSRVVWETSPCKNCVLQSVCPPLVDCPARAFIEHGDLRRVPSTYCAIYKPYLLKRLSDLMKEMSEGGTE